MSKKMMKGSGILLCLAVLAWPGRVVGQEAEQVVAQAKLARATYALQATRTRAVGLSLSLQASADTLYRAARQALNAEEYRRAIELFEESMQEEPEYSAEALYYQALAYYRLGGRNNFDRAYRKLNEQLSRYPEAASHGDAEELKVRIEGELARRGDAQAAERLAQEAQRLEEQSVRTTRQRDVRREQQVRQEHDVQQEAEIKIMALQALMQADPEKGITYLQRVLQNRTPATAELRGQAVFLLGQYDSEETLDLMVDVVQNDPDPEVKAQAAFWLSQVDDPRAVDATIAILEDPSLDDDIKGQAVFALGQTDDPRAGQILRDYAMRPDVDPEVRGMAVHGLAQHPSEENAQLLKQMFGEVQDPEVRDQILFALSQMPGAVDGDWLLGIFSDPNQDEEVRQMALFMAGQTGKVDMAVLGRMYDTADSREMKEQILFTMTQVDSEAAFDKMLQIARTEQDPELRQHAVFWIGQSGDPRAQEVLLEILDQ
jgi:tetratricopeptide (TPR) repeat protein